MTTARAIGFAVAAVAMCATAAFLFLMLSPVPPSGHDKGDAALARERHAQMRDIVGVPKAAWAVTTTMSALREMTVEVKAERLDDAPAIAWQIVQPVLDDGYDEILIYVREDGDPAHMVHRVQWTPRGGYAELTFVGRGHEERSRRDAPGTLPR